MIYEKLKIFSLNPWNFWFISSSFKYSHQPDIFPKVWTLASKACFAAKGAQCNPTLQAYLSQNDIKMQLEIYTLEETKSLIFPGINIIVIRKLLENFGIIRNI